MPRREETWLRDMLDAARLAYSFVEGQSIEVFQNDSMRSNAVVFQVLVIGEAAKSVSETTCQKYPQVNWRQLKRSRDSIVHTYFSVDLNKIWTLVHDEFPALITQLEHIIKEEYGAKD